MFRSLMAAGVIATAAAWAGGQTETPPPASETAKAAEGADDVLGVGDAAPPIAIAKWINGAPITGFEKGHVYVVVFWATWSSPSRKSIPHLSELAKKHKDKGLTIVGISSSDGGPDATDNGAAVVEKFATEQGDAIAYTIAVDNASETYKAYTQGAGQKGFPYAFVVNQDGRIAWMGNPLDEMDEPLDRIIKKEFDLDKEIAANKHWREVSDAAQPLLIRARKQVNEGDYPGVLKTVDEIIALDPEIMGLWSFYRFQIQAIQMKDLDGAYTSAKAAVEGPLKNNASVLNTMAWFIVDPESPLTRRDIPLALAAATRANELTGNQKPAIIDTLARCQFMMGEIDKAIQTQEHALSLVTEDGEMKTALAARLDEYKKAKK